MKTKSKKNIKTYNSEAEEDIKERQDEEKSVDEDDSDTDEEHEDGEEGDDDGSDDDGSDDDGSDDSSEGLNDTENNDDEDLDESATESDNDENEGNMNDSSLSKSEKIKKSLLEKYQESHGKRLYIRFPRSISSDELVEKAKELSPLIKDVHKPRQKYSRFCLVYFQSKDDREVTLKDLKKRIKKGELEKYQVDIPRTENPEYVQQIAEMKIKSLENKKVKARLKKASKKASVLNTFTTSVLVFNLPKTASVVQLREHFPAAVDIHIKNIKGGPNKDKSIASITFPSTIEARAAAKKKELSLNGCVLSIKFDNQKERKKKDTTTQSSKVKPSNAKEENAPSKNKKEALNKISKLNGKGKKKNKPTKQIISQKSPEKKSISANNKRKLPSTEGKLLGKKLKI